MILIQKVVAICSQKEQKLLSPKSHQDFSKIFCYTLYVLKFIIYLIIYLQNYEFFPPHKNALSLTLSKFWGFYKKFKVLQNSIIYNKK